ncbi:transporter [Rahnella bruchi]|uniref:transporter n=1 Tax=Rahnella bruchi TaxID=1510573 RepID=UPI000EA21516|nr:transporter [Rahnella bruchi]
MTVKHTRVFNRLMLLVCLSTPCLSYADNARDWQNVPDDINILFGYYNRIDSNTSIDSSLPINNASVDANLYILRYARSFNFGGQTAGIQILQPVADITTSADGALTSDNTPSRHGIGDTQLAFVYNLFGAPALTTEEFRRWTPGTFLTTAIWVTAPTGEYDKKKLLNIGGNRWVIKPELAFGYPAGPFWIEINPMISFYEDNNEYLGTHRLAQKPLYAAEGHFSLTLNPALWISLDSTLSKGGETRIDGVLQDNEQQNVLLGASVGFMLSPQLGGAFAYTDTTRKETGSPDISTWMVRLQYAW